MGPQKCVPFSGNTAGLCPLGSLLPVPSCTPGWPLPSVPTRGWSGAMDGMALERRTQENLVSELCGPEQEELDRPSTGPDAGTPPYPCGMTRIAGQGVGKLGLTHSPEQGGAWLAVGCTQQGERGSGRHHIQGREASPRLGG